MQSLLVLVGCYYSEFMRGLHCSFTLSPTHVIHIYCGNTSWLIHSWINKSVCKVFGLNADGPPKIWKRPHQKCESFLLVVFSTAEKQQQLSNISPSVCVSILLLGLLLYIFHGRRTAAQSFRQINLMSEKINLHGPQRKRERERAHND